MSISSTLIEKINSLQLGDVNIMEVCGTHTMSIAKAGIKQMLPSNVHLLSGPGCPVCVTPDAVMDEILRLADMPDVIITTYGDMIRVPGSTRGDNLAAHKARGSKVEIVFSPVDAVDLAAANPDKQVVFLGAGFETTAPGTAATIAVAEARGVENFTILPMLKTVEPALRALIADPDFNVQGFLCPGHVGTIIGAKGFEFLADEYHIPGVIAGFEPEDILLSVYLLLKQIKEGRAAIENEYKRAVAVEGNTTAQAMMNKYLCLVDDLWRGLGAIPQSGLGIRPEYAKYDAIKRFDLKFTEGKVLPGCRCGDVICGKISPDKCPLFGKVCLPEDPVGPCMVSSEGACAAAYKYGDYDYE